MELYQGAAVETVSGIIRMMQTIGIMIGVGMILAAIGGMLYIRSN